jgi:hypothetical protein
MWTDVVYHHLRFAPSCSPAAGAISVKKGKSLRQDSTESQGIKARHGQRRAQQETRV